VHRRGSSICPRAGIAVPDIIWDDPNYERREYDKFEAYGQSKTANILFSVELDHRLRELGVRSYAVHPGMIATELGPVHVARRLPCALRTSQESSRWWLPATQIDRGGAATSVWAATADELRTVGGVYCEDCSVSEQHAPWALDAGSAQRLWTLSETLVGQSFPAV
jgi:NAD(P)-dependent dehydrogenase (short-subunit alcohol dehydrogenase family)